MNEEESIIPGNSKDEELKSESVNDEFISDEKVIEQNKILKESSEIPKSEIQNMEVFKHPKEVMRKKNWKEYVLEFFMLFLAVFLGFIAENAREHLVERNQEKEYVQGLIEDINANNANAQAVVDDFQNRLPHLDSMVSNFGNLMHGHSDEFYRNMAFIGAYKDFYITDGTMQQLKNAGGLRLIKNKGIADSILHYDGASKILLLNQNFLDNSIFTPLWRIQGSLIDTYKLDSLQQLQKRQLYKILNKGDILLTHDRQKLVEYYSSLRSLNYDFTSWIHRLSNFEIEGRRLIALLQKKYNLKNK